MNVGMRRPGPGSITHQLGNTGQVNYPVWAHFLIGKVKTICASFLQGCCKKEISWLSRFSSRETRNHQTEGPRCPPASTEAVPSLLRSSSSLHSHVLRRLAPLASMAPSLLESVPSVTTSAHRVGGLLKYTFLGPPTDPVNQTL